MSSETVTILTNLIANIGFPIVCCGMMGYLWYQESNKHEEEMKALSEAIHNNSVVIQKLCDKLDVLEVREK